MPGIYLSISGGPPQYCSLAYQSKGLLSFLSKKKKSYYEFVSAYLSLTLLVTQVFANDHDATLAANDFALIANLLNAWINLHDLAPVFVTCNGK